MGSLLDCTSRCDAQKVNVALLGNPSSGKTSIRHYLAKKEALAEPKPTTEVEK